MEHTRINWLDNLRTTTIFLVVLYHIGGVYESTGLWGWFWIIDDPDTITWVGIMGIIFDVIVMPLLFFISGYLTPGSIDSRSMADFINGKFKRLIIPWLFAVLTLIPIYKIIFLWSRGLSQEHWTTYFHITNQNSQNWLWFLPVLFVFNLVYLAGYRFKLRIPLIKPAWAVAGMMLVSLLTSYIIGGLTGFRRWTLTPAIDFENERVIMYLLSFLMGGLFYRQQVFMNPPKGKALYIAINSTAWIPVLFHIFVRIWPFFNPDNFIITPLYRLIWWVSFYMTLVSMAYLMIESFRRYAKATAPIWSFLNQNSYGVYIIHVIMIGLFGSLLMLSSLPASLKYPLLILFTYLGSNLLVFLYRGWLKKLSR